MPKMDMQCALHYLGGAPVSWRMNRITSATLSTTEAEWYAMTLGAKGIAILRPIIEFLMDKKLARATWLFCDCKPAVQLAAHDHTPKTLKHVALRLAYLQQQRDENVIHPHHMTNGAMLADIGTKPLTGAGFWNLNVHLF